MSCYLKIICFIMVLFSFTINQSAYATQQQDMELVKQSYQMMLTIAGQDNWQKPFQLQ